MRVAVGGETPGGCAGCGRFGTGPRPERHCTALSVSPPPADRLAVAVRRRGCRVIPLALGHLSGTVAHQAPRPCCSPALLGVCRDDRQWTALAIVGLVVGSHSLLVIALAASDPTASAILPGSEGTAGRRCTGSHRRRPEYGWRTGAGPPRSARRDGPAVVHLARAVAIPARAAPGSI
jgi:hypothetical protein